MHYDQKTAVSQTDAERLLCLTRDSFIRGLVHCCLMQIWLPNDFPTINENLIAATVNQLNRLVPWLCQPAVPQTQLSQQLLTSPSLKGQFTLDITFSCQLLTHFVLTLYYFMKLKLRCQAECPSCTFPHNACSKTSKSSEIMIVCMEQTQIHCSLINRAHRI